MKYFNNNLFPTEEKEEPEVDEEEAMLLRAISDVKEESSDD